MTTSEKKALEARLDLINENLPMGYTAHIGIILTTLDENTAGVFDISRKSFRVADVVVDHLGDCVKNRWGFAK